MLTMKKTILQIILILKLKPQRADQARVINVQCLGHFEFGMSKIGQCNLSHKGLGNLIQSQK